MRFSGVRWPHQHRGRQGGARGRAMTVPLLTLLALLVAFGAEVGWLCRG
jgi:hypothetical protein